uniref:Uncharacterized protein n=1 Tax=mine drainage metagenome TaxID=410659 RepID=E6QGF8_9ZZZZ
MTFLLGVGCIWLDAACVGGALWLVAAIFQRDRIILTLSPSLFLQI